VVKFDGLRRVEHEAMGFLNFGFGRRCALIAA
jgi:hypothetical protein